MTIAERHAAARAQLDYLYRTGVIAAWSATKMPSATLYHFRGSRGSALEARGWTLVRVEDFIAGAHAALNAILAGTAIVGEPAPPDVVEAARAAGPAPITVEDGTSISPSARRRWEATR